MFSADGRILIATLPSCIVLINGGSLDLTRLPALRDVFASLSQKTQVAYLAVLEPGLEVAIAAEVRSRIAEVLNAHEALIGGVAVVYEGSGFKATGIRSIVTAIQLASRTRFPHRVFSGLPEGLAWLARCLPSAEPPIAELHGPIELLRARARSC